MMGYTVDYGSIPEGEERTRQVLSDCRSYLGNDKFGYVIAKLVEDMKDYPENTDEMRERAMAFAGLRGLPATEMIKHARERFSGTPQV